MLRQFASSREFVKTREPFPAGRWEKAMNMPPEIRSHTDGNKEEDCTEARCQEDEDDDSLDEEANRNKEVGGQEEDHCQEGDCQAVPEEEDCHKEVDS